MPPDPTRRRLLGSAGASLVVPLAGCPTGPTGGGQDGAVGIGEIRVKNLGDERRRFDVLVADRQRDETVFWRSYAASGMADTDGDGNEEIDMHVWRDPVTTPGSYVVHARTVPASGNGQRSTLSLRVESSCVALAVEVGLMETLSIDTSPAASC